MKHAIAIAFSLIFCVASFSEQAPWLQWHTQYHDTMLVPPNAQNVLFAEQQTQDELTYTVAEPYPATDFTDGLCEELRLKGWQPDGQNDCLKPKWTKIPGASRDQYEVVLRWTKWDNDSHGWVPVTYSLKYANAEDEQEGSVLHVSTFAAHRVTGPEAAKNWPVLSDRMFTLAILSLYLLVLAGIIRLVAVTKVRDAIFYRGPSDWRTWTNLALFSPVAALFLSVGVLFASGIVGAGLVAFLPILFGLALCALAGAVMTPISVIITGTILFAEDIPGNVKIAHLIFGLLSLSFWVVCIVYFSPPLFHW